VNKSKRNLTVTLVGVATAVGLAVPAHADPITDPSFLSALSNAGVGYNDPADTTSLGQSVCPMLVQPGQSFASVASSMGNQGISPGMASFFTGIAIQMYCPQMMSSIGNGSFMNFLQQTPGVPGVPGLTGAPGLPGGPGLPQLPGF
jgi:hypothetical protein